ncbi:MAG: hypothetical protein H7317_11215 [Pseudorhodobacter sp.]|nr:hypothetical protein [Pseudorhodobacter sp.]
MLVVKVKSQRNEGLFTGAEGQLAEQYAIHPAAEKQGIYLVLWFGPDEWVAGKKPQLVMRASQLRQQLEYGLPAEIVGKIDIVVYEGTASAARSGDLQAYLPLDARSSN